MVALTMGTQPKGAVICYETQGGRASILPEPHGITTGTLTGTGTGTYFSSLLRRLQTTASQLVHKQEQVQVHIRLWEDLCYSVALRGDVICGSDTRIQGRRRYSVLVCGSDSRIQGQGCTPRPSVDLIPGSKGVDGTPCSCEDPIPESKGRNVRRAHLKV